MDLSKEDLLLLKEALEHRINYLEKAKGGYQDYDIGMYISFKKDLGRQQDESKLLLTRILQELGLG